MIRRAGGAVIALWLLPALLAVVSTAYARREAIPAVVAVYPSGAEIPERLLRLSVRFATPPADRVLPEIALRRDDGSMLGGALLDQELWSPDRQTLTLLLDPGRVKTGLIAHDAAGWALVRDDMVTLTIGGIAVHRWRVMAGGCRVPESAAWHIAAPLAGTRAALTIGFPAPVDAQAVDLLAVIDAAGSRVAGGSVSLGADEREWRFVPDQTWMSGEFRLLVHPDLESPCGDRVGAAFEHTAANGPDPPREAVLRFRID